MSEYRMNFYQWLERLSATERKEWTGRHVLFAKGDVKPRVWSVDALDDAFEASLSADERCAWIWEVGRPEPSPDQAGGRILMLHNTTPASADPPISISVAPPLTVPSNSTAASASNSAAAPAAFDVRSEGVGADTLRAAAPLTPS
jgi:hypothetical protein